MFFKHLDFLSPRVTFYYKGFLSHTSIISGIISLITIICIIYLTIYYSIDIFKRNNPNSFHYQSFIKDAGIFNINTSSLFHFINIAKFESGYEINEGIDFTKFTIIGMNAYLGSYLNHENELEKLDHWLYGFCEKDINTDGLDDLLTYNFFEKSACIKKYYHYTEKKYYNIGDPEFVWPKIAYGTINELNKIYGIYIQKCYNKTIKYILGDEFNCKSDSEIEQFFNISEQRVMNLYFIDNFINVLNYKNPINRFFHRIENPIKKKVLSQNDINFNPVIVKSHDGFVFDNINENISYTFDRNDVYIDSYEGSKTYISYCFILKNTREYYERVYKRIQDLISLIGGLFQAINIIAYYINSLYHNFIVLSDTEASLNASIHTEKVIHKIKLDELRTSKMKDIKKKKKNDENKKTYENQKLNESKNNKTDLSDKDDKDMSKISFNYISNLKEKYRNFNLKNNNKINNNIINKNDDFNKKNIHILNEKNNFFYYLFYKITCNKNNPFKIYENFRMKIISEKHLIRNHLNIYNLLKVTEKRRHKRNTYHLADLIKLV